MASILSQFYGDNTRWFIATVIDASPPYGYEGRVKIRVHGLHTGSTKDIPQSDLPWAQCVLPTTEGGVSGIGRIPQLQPGALVFGLFMDGKNSQTPLVFGSIPHVEFPSLKQQLQKYEDVGKDDKPASIWEKLSATFAPDFSNVENEESGPIQSLTLKSRQKAAIRFFINVGYSVKQAVGITTGLTSVSGLMTGVHPRGSGIASWSPARYSEIKNFSNKYEEFYTQLAFLVYDLRGKQTVVNIKLLQSDKVDGNDGTVSIFMRNYLKKPVSANAKRIAQDLFDQANGS